MTNLVVVMKGGAREATIGALKRLEPTVTGTDILIKPNLASRVRDRGENTDVKVVEGIVEYFQGKGDITIAEGCCGAIDCKPASTHELFEYAHYTYLEDRYGVRLLDLNVDEFVKVRLHDKVLGVARSALEADYLITAPVLKTHVYTTLSGCVKNLMGCLEPRPSGGIETATKWEIHSELWDCDTSDTMNYLNSLRTFELRLIELYKRLSPRLGVIDAIVASEGEAPVHGTSLPLGMVMASENPIACDAVAAHLMGVEPTRVGFLGMAYEEKLGEVSIEKIETNVELQPLIRKFKLPEIIQELNRH